MLSTAQLGHANGTWLSSPGFGQHIMHGSSSSLNMHRDEEPGVDDVTRSGICNSRIVGRSIPHTHNYTHTHTHTHPHPHTQIAYQGSPEASKF